MCLAREERFRLLIELQSAEQMKNISGVKAYPSVGASRVTFSWKALDCRPLW